MSIGQRLFYIEQQLDIVFRVIKLKTEFTHKLFSLVRSFWVMRVPLFLVNKNFWHRMADSYLSNPIMAMLTFRDVPKFDGINITIEDYAKDGDKV